MKTFEEFMVDKGYDYHSYDRCFEMSNIITEYGEYCATAKQEPAPTRVYEEESMCKHERFIESLGKPQSNREYWIMTEIFVYLHEGKDYCTCKREEA